MEQNKHPIKFFLFDVDGTILDSGGAGSRSLDMAFKEVFSIESAFTNVSMAGKTDLQIIKEACMIHNILTDNGFILRVLSSYLDNLSREINKGQKRLKPGIAELLEQLHMHPFCVLGLLTGNIKEGAKIKLSSFGLDHYFITGGFGSDSDDRNLLLPIAADRYRRMTGRGLEYRDCIVIGDTPLDVSCSKPYGAFSVAVATGPYSEEDLTKAGADLVLNDLTDKNGFITACFS